MDHPVDRRHNGGPSMEPSKFNKRKWAKAILERPKKPTGAVAMAFKLYIEMDADGRGAVIPDTEFTVSCGASDKSVRTFKKWLLDNGFVEIKVKGTRGRHTEFIARIPGDEIAETVAAVMEQIPAAIAGNRATEDRQSIPENANGLPVMETGNRPSPVKSTAVQADQASRAPARKESPSEIDIYNTTNKLANSESMVGAGLAGLNGSAEPMLQDIVAWMNAGDERAARQWLANSIQTLGTVAMRDAYTKLKTDILEGQPIARPLQVWIKIAQGLKNGGRQGSTAGKPLSKTFAARMVEQSKGGRS